MQADGKSLQPQFMRPSLLGTTFALLVQFLLGMVINLFVTIPTSHPGAQTPQYFAGVVQVIGWAVATQWPWIALHVGFGVILAVTGVTFLLRAWRAGQRNVVIWCIVGGLAAIVAAFNGASFLIYGQDFSSMIMAAGFALSIGSYIVGLFLARQGL
jgi:hypothetical protein